MQKKAPYSIDGNGLHESLSSIFKVSQERRHDDILKVACFNDFGEGYTSGKGKIPVMEDDKLNKTNEKEIDTHIHVLIECIEDANLKERSKIYFSSLKKNELDKKEDLMNNLLGQNYEFK